MSQALRRRVPKRHSITLLIVGLDNLKSGLELQLLSQWQAPQASNFSKLRASRSSGIYCLGFGRGFFGIYVGFMGFRMPTLFSSLSVCLVSL